MQVRDRRVQQRHIREREPQVRRQLRMAPTRIVHGAVAHQTAQQAQPSAPQKDFFARRQNRTVFGLKRSPERGIE